MVTIAYKKKRVLQVYSCVLAIIFMMIANSCTKCDLPQGESSAFFDTFTYVGNDDYYNNNPLTAPNQYYNPILPGWNSDPSICRRGNDYFLVTSSFVYYPGVPIFHSTDLINWKQIGYVLNRESQLQNFSKQHTSGGIFAPAISYNPANKTFYMITTNVGAGNFYVKTTDPFSGNWSEPIYLPSVQGIDPSFFFDENGKAYIVNNDAPIVEPRYDGHRAIKIREFDVANDCTIGEEKVIVDGGIHPEENPVWIEGPHLYKIGGYYYLMAAEGGTSENHSEVILRSLSPWGPFEVWKQNPILTQRSLDPKRANPITCAGHADLIQTPQGDWWAVFLACRPIDNEFENLGRETFLMPVRWNDDYPYITHGNEEVPMIVNKTNAIRGENTTFGNFSYTDNFDSDTLAIEWMTLRSSAQEHYSLTQNKGFLTLKCSNQLATQHTTPAFVCRRIQHHKFTCTTSMYLNLEDTTESAGMLLYKDEFHQYYMSVKKSLQCEDIIAVEKISREGVTILASTPLKQCNAKISLKVESDGRHFTFSYADKNGDWKQLITGVDARYLSTANSWGFTGTTIGLYATKEKK